MLSGDAPLLGLLGRIAFGSPVRLLGVALSVTTGCAGARLPPGLPPSPESVTLDDPGGNAHDPHEAALTRLLDEPWGRRSDRDNQLLVPLSDRRHWKRVRYWLLDHFTGFKYGDDFHALNVVFVRPLDAGRDATVEACMDQLEGWAFPQASAFQLEMGPIDAVYRPWRDQQILVHTTEAHLDYGIGEGEFVVAWASYPAYPDTCTVFAVALPTREQRELAYRVRSRWVDEGFSKLKPKTLRAPVRAD